MGKSNIAWTDETWNPVTGCTKVSPGCARCYAETFAERWRGIPGHPYEQGFDLRLWPERLERPLHWRKPRRVFVNSMSDLFHKDAPDEFILSVWHVMAQCPQHSFQVLSKRPERMAEWTAEFTTKALPNVWLGTSVEDQQRAAERIPHLLLVRAKARFLSIEPLLGPVTLARYWGPPTRTEDQPIRWVIVGGESGPGARPMELDWLESLVDECRAAGVPVFVKQDSGRWPGKQGRIPDRLWIKEFPSALQGPHKTA